MQDLPNAESKTAGLTSPEMPDGTQAIRTGETSGHNAHNGAAPSNGAMPELTHDARRILDRMSDAHIVIDRNCCFVYANPAAERSMQKSLDELRGRSHWEVFPASYDFDAGVNYRRAVYDRVESHFTQHYNAEGYDVYLEMDAYPTDEGGAAIFWRDVTTRVKAERALRASEERYALAARAASNAIWEWDLVAHTRTWAEGMTTLFAYPAGSLPTTQEWWADAIHPDDRERVIASVDAVVRGTVDREEWRAAYRFRRNDNTYAEVLDRGYVVRDGDARATRMIGALEDASERRTLEAQLRQAQKMEAVGQLAGGVAHDFNNLLTVVTGNLEFVRQELPSGHPSRADLEEIAVAADRARSLVRQLLIFSRQQQVQQRPLRLGDVVLGAERLLRRVIGEEIAFQVHVDGPGPVVLGDAGQVEQVLMNLAVNARDAMLTPRNGFAGTGGALTIELETHTLGPDEAVQWSGIRAGGYARLVVRDTGHGMDEETRARAFEPFFTTKAVGVGTGLGLATVHGIVRQAGGAIQIASAPGEGTTFIILWPIASGDPGFDTPVGDVFAVPAPGTTVLVVEDETPVRAVMRRMLERQGYTVIEARHGVDAMLVWKDQASRISVVVTDLRMPEMGGRELVNHLRKERPKLPVVFVSGYSDEGARTPRGAYERYVEKPFTPDRLLRAIGTALGLGVAVG